LEKLRQLEADLQRIKSLTENQLQREPNNAAICHEIAMIFLRAGIPQQGLIWLLNALQANPDHVPTHRALAVYYHEVGNPILAARHRALAQRLAEQSRP